MHKRLTPWRDTHLRITGSAVYALQERFLMDCSYASVYRATTSYFKDLLECGSKVYLYSGFLHSKMLVVDEKIVSIGTANMDVRSFSSNFEVNTFIYNSELSSQCSEISEKDLARSKLVTKELYDKRGLMIKLQEGLCRLLSPFL